MQTLKEFLDYIAFQYDSSSAYEWLEKGEIISKSFADLQKDAYNTACRLNNRFGMGKKIALIGDMSYAWICTYYGIMIGSNITVPMDTKLKPEEIIERLNFADVSVVFLSLRYITLKDIILSKCDCVTEVLCLEDYALDLSDTLSTLTVSVDPDALASLMFTSGTSGDGLKAAMITQRNILADVTGRVPLCVPGDRLLSLLPVHHCFEIFVGQMKYLYLGGTICINDSMNNLIPNLARFGITIVVAVPALTNMLAAFITHALKEHSLEEVKQMLGGRLRRITIGGASTSKDVIKTLGMVGITVFVGYGLTETAGGCFANCDASIHPREAGAPYVDGMEMKLEDGELCLRGPMIMQGYYKSPELTSKVIVDGWFHTGDLAEITDDGYIIINGRKDNMIKTSNGEKIYPEEWEKRLSTIDGVSAAMVANIDDHLTAILLLKDDTVDNRAAANKAIDVINAGLPGYEKILDVRFREKPFPMTTSMKIKRREVIKEFSGLTVGSIPSALAENELQQRILDKVMQVLPSETVIGIDDNLYEYGLDSLLTIQLAMLLECSPEAIYACKTIRCLSERLNDDASLLLPYQSGTKIDNIDRYINITSKADNGLGDTVLLTGASGYLGAHIMAELVQEGHKVICLVRSKDSLKRACEYYGFAGLMPKVSTVIGDITVDNLGLSQNQFDNLCRDVDSVIHAAALVSHVGGEDASFRVNVRGTQEILRFCLKGDANLFHISTYAVTGFGTDSVLTEDKLDIGQEIALNPYIQTKYQAEEQVLISREHGVSSTIFRVGNLSARASDGLFQMNATSNGMAAQLRAIRKMGVFPECMRDMPYDATEVDKAAKAIILLAKESGTGHIWHIMNPRIGFLPQLTGAQMVSDAEFVDRLSEGMNDRDVAILSVYYRMAQAGFNTRFDSSKTQNKMEQLGFSWD